MNLGQAITAFKSRGFQYIDQDDPTKSTRILNRARNELEDYWPWPWLRKTTTGPAPLAIPDLKYVLWVKDSTGNPVYGVDERDVDTDQTGAPDSWWLDGPDATGQTTIRFAPVGPGTFTVRYVMESPELSNSTDTPLIPSRYHPLWIDLAVVHGYRDDDNYAAAGSLAADLEARLLRLVERYETRNRQSSQFMAYHGLSEDD